MQSRVFKLPTDKNLINGIVFNGFAAPLLVALGNFACAVPFGDIVLGKDHLEDSGDDVDHLTDSDEYDEHLTESDAETDQ